jgi:transposase, IS5 family
MTSQHKRWLKRRQAIEPMIGHTKSDNRMDRCWLQGALGDPLHALNCATG